MLIPARDEAEVIERSVRAALAQPVRKIIVIDDRSTDGTAEILERLADPRLQVLAGIGPQSGECGKPAALVHALRTVQVDTEWLLFLDADVLLDHGAVPALYAATDGVDLVSVIPRVTLASTIEKMVMPSIGALILAAHPPDRIDEIPFANGQVILVRRSVYERSGGHRAVISEILEDVRLAQKVRAAGGKLRLCDGRKIAATHMYEGWAQIVEGWSRNLYLLTGGTKASAYKWIVLTTALTWLGPLAAILDFPRGFLAWGAIAAMQAILRHKGGAPAFYAILAPISALLVDYILLRSLRYHERRQPIPWKGRLY